MKHGSLLLTILLVLALVVAACGGSKDEPAPAATDAPAAAAPATAPQEPAPAATDTPVPPTPTPLPPTPAAEEEDEPLAVERLAVLESLDSYRVQMTYITKGFDGDNNPVDNSAEILSEYTRSPEASRTVFTIIDNAATDADDRTFTWEMVQVDQDLYMSMGDEMGWIRTAAEESPLEGSILGAFSGGDFFTNLDQMQRVRPDQRINGIDSRHYRFDERVLTAVFDEDLESMSAEGDVWVAKDGGFITKYVVTITHRAGQRDGFAGELLTGTTEIAFEVKDVNTPIKIEIPAEATAGVKLAGFEGEDFPLPPGARVQMASANFTIIESDTPASEVVEFYEEALAALGWTKDEQSSMSFGSLTSLTFTKGSTELSLIVTFDEDSGKTQIMINAE